MAVNQHLILYDIITERERQDKKWGTQRHPMPMWVAILTEEVGEVAEESLRNYFGALSNEHELREELIQVAAVAVAIVEQIDEALEKRGEKSYH